MCCHARYLPNESKNKVSDLVYESLSNWVMVDIRQYLYKKYIIRSFYNFMVCVLKGFPLKTLYLCEIPVGSIPKSVKFIHPYSIVIRKGTKIGNNCIIHQNVTIGQRRKENTFAVIGNNINIGANVVILGDIHIGDNCVIGAGSVVLDDIPNNSIVVGNPARIIAKEVK